VPALAHLPAEAHHSGIREIANEAIRTPGAIRLDVGQPNFPTPKHIGDAGKRAIDENMTFYTHTQGLISLREKLVTKLERVNGIRVTPDRIACAPGGVGALAAVYGAVLEHGDEVLMPDPGWPNTRMMLAWTGANGIFYPCSAEAGFQPDIDALARLVTPRTKMLLINSPNNPTGAVYPEATVAQLVELAQRHNLWLLSDECYDQIILDGSWTSPASLAPRRPTNRQRLHLLEVLFDDGLADRLCGRLGRADRHGNQGSGVQLVVCLDDQPGGCRGGHGRAAGLCGRDGRRLPAPPQRGRGHLA
jgi:aspartate/methionine/tyrosine aminotransferase